MESLVRSALRVYLLDIQVLHAVSSFQVKSRLLKLQMLNVKVIQCVPQNPGDSWRYHYDKLWDSFDMMEEQEEEEDFFDELDIL